MTINEWADDFRSFVNELQMPRDDYKGIMEYINDAVVLLKEHGEKTKHLNNITLEYEKEVFRLQTMLKEQDELLRKLQKDKDKLCLDVSEWKHKYHDRPLKEREPKPDKCIICEGCGHKLQDDWNWCPWCRWETARGRRVKSNGF